MRIAVTSTQAEQIADRNIARTQGWLFVDQHDEKTLREYDPELLVILGWYVPDMQTWWQYRELIGNIPKVAVLWAGTDVMQCKEFWDAGERAMFKDLKSDRYCHIPEHEWMKDELLKFFSLETTDPLASPVPKLFEEMPMPEEFKVSVYSPMTRYTFYNLGTVAEAMSETGIPVIWYHFGMEYAKIEYPGTCERRFGITRDEYEKVIADSSCAIRIPEHDGLSIGAAEFLMAGRPVVTCHDMPRYPRMIKGQVSAEKVRKAVLRIREGEFVPEGVQKFYRDLFDPVQYKVRMQERLRTKWDGLSLDG